MTWKWVDDDEDDEVPCDDSPEVLAAVALIRRVYKFDASGGGLHSTIDDGNVDGPVTRFEDNDAQYSKAQIAAETKCAAALDALSMHQRYSALNRAHGNCP